MVQAKVIECYYTLIVQTIPTGVPTTLCSNDENIDMATLQQGSSLGYLKLLLKSRIHSFTFDLLNKATESGDCYA